MHSVVFFVDSIVPKQESLKILLIFNCTPLFGVFGVTVSHDVFQAAGIILLTSVLIRSLSSELIKKETSIALTLSALYLTTTQYGIIILILCCLYLIRRSFVIAISSIVVGVIVYSLSTISITNESQKTPREEYVLRDLLLADIKCIAQHDQSEITLEEWTYLEVFAPRSAWKEKVSCATPDELLAPLALRDNNTQVSFELLQTSIKIFLRQPAIPVMSHIQRSRMALPPPFFQPPSNQVDLDVKKPIGLNTNTSLQAGPGLLHPSVDDDIMASRPSFLRPLEAFALLPAFIINQASWFWSWGGLWIYPFIFLLVMWFSRSTTTLIKVLAPTLVLHSILFIVGPSSLGRYVMSTITMGVICLIILLNHFLQGKPDEI
jgi:hypothetical protein